MKARDYLPPTEPTYTIAEFGIAERISRVALSAFWKRGKGPDYYMNGKCRRITHQARLTWQRRRVAETMGGAGEAA